jgi:lauroyl/myristoyl acyltransferase
VAAPPVPGERPAAGESEWHVGPWEWVSLTLLRGLASAALLVMGLGGLYRLGCWIGTAEWLFRPGRRRRFAATVSRELGRSLSREERRRITRGYFVRMRCDKLFYLIFDSIPPAQRESLFSIRNREILDEAVARGRGVYAILAHHGAPQVIGLFMPLLGYRVAAVRDPHEGGLRRFVQRRLSRKFPATQRTRFLFNDSFAREVYRCLQDGYVLGSAIDVARLRNSQQRTEEVTMFGQPRFLLTGPLHIALRCRAPVIQAFCVPEEGFRYRLDLLGPLIDPDTVDDQDAAIRRAVRTYAANVERYLAESPSMLTRL